MKQLFKKIFSPFNKLWLLSSLPDRKLKGSHFYFSRIKTYADNSIRITGCLLDEARIVVEGKNNTIIAEEGFIARTEILIIGNNNKIILGKGVKLRGAIINMRGESCSIVIGEGTTFGGVRMINVGKNNAITIGSNCLFSDGIELWASDTHAILDESGAFINPEKPITIGNNVWVGSKVTILKGITIGDGSIIGLGSVVTKDVPAKVISAGYPNKTLKENISWQLDYPKQ
ncbi:MAG: acyltransferase [Mucilaginibacter sp.]